MTTTDPSEPTPAVKAAAADLLDQCQLVDVRATRIVGEISSEGLRPVAAITMVPTLEYFAATGQYSNRFHYHFELNDDVDENVATLEFTLVLDWAVPPDFTPDRAAADFVASSTGYFAAYPYLRELLHSLSTRLGIDPIVLGALRRDNLAPNGFTIVLRPPIANTMPADTGAN